MGLSVRRRARLLLCAGALVLSTVAAFRGGVATADTAPPNPNDPKTPVTVAADGLPTAQLNGVGWDQVIIGNTVYVVGSFSAARPAGADPGTQEVTRNNILAYDITTGALINSFAPNLNGQALAIRPSPDNSILYVGGSFTSVNGMPAGHLAALNPTTGALIPTFKVSAAGAVNAIVTRGATVWFGGTFTKVNGVVRTRLAAVDAANGALRPWAPVASSTVNALALSPDGTKMVVGGKFTTLNGSSNPGYGLAAVDAVSGQLLPFPVNNLVRDAGDYSAILALASDANNVYANGYVFGPGGTLEGSVAIKWSDFTIAWLEDCHGDTYMTYPASNALYVVGHPHYCGNIGGYPEVKPRKSHRAIAFSKVATGTVARNTEGNYHNWAGQPAPSLLNWFPVIDTGTYTGKNQGAWAVTGNDQYIVLAGEFRHINGKSQQGMVRFAISSIAPNKRGPQAIGTDFQPTLTSPGSGQVKVSIPSNWDQDNTNLTYRIFLDGQQAPVTTFSSISTFWIRPTLTYTATALAGGSHSVRVTATDPFGNSVSSPTVSITINGAAKVLEAPRFTLSTSGLRASFDVNGSPDPSAAAASYQWDFGDGDTATGATSRHTYAAAGSYRVTLTVTDDQGRTTVRSRTVGVAIGSGGPD